MYRSTSLDQGRPVNRGTVPTLPTATSATEASARDSRSQLRHLIALTAPTLITNLCQVSLPLMSFAFAGFSTAGAADLAGLGLGISVSNLTGACVFYGMGTGIDLLCSQAFGAKNHRLVGVAFMRGTLLTGFTFIPVAIVWYNMNPILRSIGQQESIAKLTGQFCRAYLWGMIPYAVFENLKRCLQAQDVAIPVMIVAALGAVANIVFHYITVYILNLGVEGAGIALSLTGMFLLLTLVFCTWIFRLGAEGCWSGLFSMDVFKHWRKYLALSIPGCVSTLIEWTSWEASTILAGLLSGDENLATQVMVLNAYNIVFQFALSINIGVTMRVGNLLGGLDADGARKSAWCGVRLAIATAATAALGLWLGRSQWPRLYGAPDDVLDTIVGITPVFLAAQMIDMVQMVSTGIVRGMGYQHTQAKAAFFGFWCVGVPLSAYLGIYREWGLAGLWGGMAIAETPLLVFYLYVIRSTDWDRCVREAEARVAEQSEFVLPETVPTPRFGLYSPCDSSSGSDSDSESGGGNEATAAPTTQGDAVIGTGGQVAGSGLYNFGDRLAMKREVSGGVSVELPLRHAPGEKTTLLEAAPLPGYGGGSHGGGSDGGGGDVSRNISGVAEINV